MTSQTPLGYTGINYNTQPQFITANRAPTINDFNFSGTQWLDQSVNPGVIYETSGGGVWNVGGNVQASTTVAGITRYATAAEVNTGTGTNNAALAVDVFNLAQSIVVGAVPAASETNAGIAEIATQIETNAGVDDARIVTPLKLANAISGAGFDGSFNTLSSVSTVSLAAVGGTVNISSDTNTALEAVGAGINLELLSSAGSVSIEGDEAVADAIRILSTAGGMDVDVALQMSLVSSQNAASAVVINASAGGIDIIAAGGVGEDIDITNTAGSINLTAGESGNDSIVIASSIGGIQINAAGASAGEDITIAATGSSVNITSTENAVLAINLHANGGSTETVAVRAEKGTGVGAVELLADVGGITLTAGKATATAINLTTTDAAGGVTVTAGTGGILPSTTGKYTVISTANAAEAIELHANGGTSETIRIRSDQGTAATSLDLLSDVGGITLNAGLSSANAITMNASGVAGGFNIDSGTGGFIVDTTGAVSLDSALASNLTVTGVADLTLSSVGGSVVISGTEAVVDAVQINATTALGGIDVNAGTGGITVDSGGLMSLDAAGAVNVTTTGAFDITVNSTAGSIVVTGAEAAVDAVQLNASDAAGGIDINAGTGGITIDTTAALSLDSATASNFTVTGAADLTLNSTAGAVNITSGEANLDSINITSAGGVNFVATGAAAKDTIITNTNGSMTLTAGENVTDAMNIVASGAASRVTITAGTGSINLDSGLIVPVTSVVFADSPYTVLGTDYLISVDTSGGATTVTLPDAAAVAGRTYVIRDTGGAAAASNITIGTGGGNLVGGGAAAATKVISANYAGATVYSNGVTWNYCQVV